jgi:hypothetical protein
MVLSMNTVEAPQHLELSVHRPTRSDERFERRRDRREQRPVPWPIYRPDGPPVWGPRCADVDDDIDVHDRGDDIVVPSSDVAALADFFRAAIWRRRARQSSPKSGVGIRAHRAAVSVVVIDDVVIVRFRHGPASSVRPGVALLFPWRRADQTTGTMLATAPTSSRPMDPDDHLA